MMFENWEVIKILRSEVKNVYKGYISREDDSCHYKDKAIYHFLLIDDDYSDDEEEVIPDYVQRFLSNKEGQSYIEDDAIVYLYCTGFVLGRELINQPDEVDFYGIFQDLSNQVDDDRTGADYLSDIRNLQDVTPRPGILVVSQYIGHSDVGIDKVKSAQKRHSHVYAVNKTPFDERTDSEFEQLENFFDYIKRRRKFLDSSYANEYKRFVGNATFKKIYEFIELLKHDPNRKMPVMITGESGTGKELVARLIHCYERGDDVKGKDLNNFQALLISAVSKTVLESTLFGHRKGSFTGADSDFDGLIKGAEKGTLFLDEIADLEPAIQNKLMRFLQEDEIQPLGAKKPETVNDVRKVFATNQDFIELCRTGKMREDFVHRLDGLNLKLPSLQEREEDLEDLIDYFILQSGFLKRSGLLVETAMTQDTRDIILNLCREGAFVGNVRQLERFITRMFFMADSTRPVNYQDFERTCEFSILSPLDTHKLKKPTTHSNEATESSFSRIFNDHGWNAFIKLSVQEKGRKMKQADSSGIKPQAVVNYLVETDLKKGILLEQLTDTRGEIDSEIVQAGQLDITRHLTSLYCRNKSAWIKKAEKL